MNVLKTAAHPLKKNLHKEKKKQKKLIRKFCLPLTALKKVFECTYGSKEISSTDFFRTTLSACWQYYLCTYV